MAWGKRERSPLYRHIGCLWTFQSHIRQHHGLAAQAELSFTSVKLHPINPPDRWHEAAHCWQGEGQEVPNGLYCEQLLSDRTTQTHREESIVWVCARPSFPFSLHRLSLSPHPPLALCMRGEHTGGRGKTIMLGSHKSTGHNSRAIYY